MIYYTESEKVATEWVSSDERAKQKRICSQSRPVAASSGCAAVVPLPFYRKRLRISADACVCHKMKRL